jgi:hypothetical protein
MENYLQKKGKKFMITKGKDESVGSNTETANKEPTIS